MGGMSIVFLPQIAAAQGAASAYDVAEANAACLEVLASDELIRISRLRRFVAICSKVKCVK